MDIIKHVEYFCKVANIPGPPPGTVGVVSFEGDARQQAETFAKEFLSKPMWTQETIELGGDKYIVKIEPHSNAPKGVSFYKVVDPDVKPSKPTTSTPGTVVKPEKTPLSSAEASAAIKTAYTRLYGNEPTNETLAILVAQWAHETGNGRSMYNYNFGGIKGKGPSGLTTAYKTREGWGATEVKITDYFRAYNSADEGAEDYLKLLQRRFPKALDQANAGNPEEFVRALKQKGYFTGNEQAYIKSIKSLSDKALAAQTKNTEVKTERRIADVEV